LAFNVVQLIATLAVLGFIVYMIINPKFRNLVVYTAKNTVKKNNKQKINTKTLIHKQQKKNNTINMSTSQDFKPKSFFQRPEGKTGTFLASLFLADWL
jgi:hypothetical protein